MLNRERIVEWPGILPWEVDPNFGGGVKANGRKFRREVGDSSHTSRDGETAVRESGKSPHPDGFHPERNHPKVGE